MENLLRKKGTVLRRTSVLLGLLLGCVSASATPLAEAPAEFSINADGSFDWRGTYWSAVSYNSSWMVVKQDALQPLGGKAPMGASVEDGRWSFRVTGTVPAVGSRSGRVWTLEEHLRHLGENTIGVNYRVSFPDKVEGEIAALLISFPIADSAGKEAEIGGQTLVLPKAQGEKPVLFSGRIDGVTIPVAGGRLSLKCSGHAQLQDNRRWGSESYSLRIHFERVKGGLPTDYALWVSAKFIP